MAFYSSYGAAQEVTGSCHLLEIGNIKILIDCGLFQGKEDYLNYKEFGFNPNEINYVILTHAHLDHIGRLPLLVKNGFDKKIITTKATFELAQLMLRNAAGILQEKEVPLYDYEDVENTLNLFETFLNYEETFYIEEDIKITFKNAGHILGSATVKIDYFEDSMNKSLLFSGDIGQPHRIITSKIDTWDNANYVFLESTYADRIHSNLEKSINSFKKQIINTLNKDGVVVIPAFALERTQEVLYILKQMSEEKLLKDVPVFLDSPLAINLTRVFTKFPELFSKDITDILKSHNNPFAFKELISCYTRDDSIQINETVGKKIIIAGSGMCEGGRIPYHLSRYITDENNSIIFVGYQVEGTLGRKILDGNKVVRIHNMDTKVKANISLVDGFSAHADQNDLINFVKDFNDIFCIYLIHGDASRLDTLKDKLEEEYSTKVHIVKMKEKIYI